MLLVIGSVAFRPMIDPRRTLFVAPYLLLTLAIGAVYLGQRSRWLALSLFLVLGAFHGLGVSAYRDRIASPVDLKGFADRLLPRLRSDDLIFLHQGWYETPVLYYVKPDHYRVLARNFAEACARNPNARVWVVLFSGGALPPDMQPALDGYREVETVDDYQVRGVLYCRGPCR
jgi:hypothetical protein